MTVILTAPKMVCWKKRERNRIQQELPNHCEVFCAVCRRKRVTPRWILGFLAAGRYSEDNSSYWCLPPVQWRQLFILMFTPSTVQTTVHLDVYPRYSKNNCSSWCLQVQWKQPFILVLTLDAIILLVFCLQITRERVQKDLEWERMGLWRKVIGGAGEG